MGKGNVVRRTATFLSFLVAFVALAGCQSLALKTVAEQAYYPGKLGIERQKNLSALEREIEARFAAYLEESSDQAIALYQSKFGKEINTDNARELSKDYAPGGIEAMDSKTIAARNPGIVLVAISDLQNKFRRAQMRLDERFQ